MGVLLALLSGLACGFLFGRERYKSDVWHDLVELEKAQQERRREQEARWSKQDADWQEFLDRRRAKREAAHMAKVWDDIGHGR